MKRGMLLAVCAGFCFAAFGEAKKPKLVVGIVVDQMRWDYLYRYERLYTEGGFKRLMGEGFRCEQTFINYVPSYTAPGHASIFTGSVPALHGIVGNDWQDRVSGEDRYCAQDDLVRAVGGSAAAGRMSPRQMLASTVGDELRLATNFKSRVFGVALKDRGAIFPAGQMANGAFWFDDSSGNFMSSTYYADALPQWLQHFNKSGLATRLMQQTWETLYPLAFYTQSTADENAYEHHLPGKADAVFPYPPCTQFKELRYRPAGNALTFACARALVQGGHLGNAGATDMLTVSLSGTDYAGHAFGPNAVETEDMYLRLDRQLARFLAFLDEEIGPDEYTVFLTADHGGAHNPAFVQDHKGSAGVLSENDLVKVCNAALKQRFRRDSLVSTVMNYQVFLNLPAIARYKLDRAAIMQCLKDTLRHFPQIAFVVDAENLASAHLPDPLKIMLSKGFMASRCGDLLLIYAPAFYSGSMKGTTHGTWNPYDTHIPLLWYGCGIRRGSTYARTEISDIAVTLAALLQIQMPNAAVGKVIEALIR